MLVTLSDRPEMKTDVTERMTKYSNQKENASTYDEINTVQQCGQVRLCGKSLGELSTSLYYSIILPALNYRDGNIPQWLIMCASLTGMRAVLVSCQMLFVGDL